MAVQAADSGVTILIEPLNTFDFPGYFLTHQDQAHSIAADVAQANVKVQMDFYHCQIMEGNLADKASAVVLKDETFVPRVRAVLATLFPVESRATKAEPTAD